MSCCGVQDECHAGFVTVPSSPDLQVCVGKREKSGERSEKRRGSGGGRLEQ